MYNYMDELKIKAKKWENSAWWTALVTPSHEKKGFYSSQVTLHLKKSKALNG